MNGQNEVEALDAMLTAEDRYIDDDGFTARVMDRLPPPKLRVAWARIAILLGASGTAALVAILSHPLSAAFDRALSGVLLGGTLSAAPVVMLAMLLWAGVTAVQRE